MNIDELGSMVARRRGNMGVRAAASEIGISPTTLSRIENGHVPDITTLEKVCAWLGEDTSKFTGIGNLQIAFKNRKAVPTRTARSLASLIEVASKQFAEKVEARGH
jgi:transcriptional regulator with XRE-family HTH domain